MWLSEFIRDRLLRFRDARKARLTPSPTGQHLRLFIPMAEGLDEPDEDGTILRFPREDGSPPAA